MYNDNSVNDPSLPSELYGPLMVVLTLIAVMLAGMKATGQTVQEGTLMGTAIGTCFGYWIGASIFFFGLAYFCDTNLSPIEVKEFVYTRSEHVL